MTREPLGAGRWLWLVTNYFDLKTQAAALDGRASGGTVASTPVEEAAG
jgi:hypothetical protein